MRMKFNYPAPPQHQTASTAKIISRTILATIKQPAKPVKQGKKKSVLRFKCNAYGSISAYPSTTFTRTPPIDAFMFSIVFLRFWRQTVPLPPKQSAGK